MSEPKSFSLAESLRAQNALREAAGSPPEQFPVPAFVGMISDEIETLRDQGRTDADIAGIIAAHSSIRVTPEEIADNYATPEQRGAHGGPPGHESH